MSFGKGDPVGYMLPYPRQFIDNYKLVVNEDGIAPDIIEDERTTASLFGEERNKIDTNYAGGVGGRYMRGEDIYGNKLPDHQRSLDSESSESPTPKMGEEKTAPKQVNPQTEPPKDKPKCPFHSLWGGKK